MKSFKIFICGALLGGVLSALFTRTHDFLASNPALSLLNPMTTDKKISEIYSILDNYYAGEYDKEYVHEGLYEGLIHRVGDRYTSYMDKDAYSSYRQSTEGTYAGIGVTASRDDNDGHIVILSVIEGSPAQTAGLMDGDKITSIDGYDATRDNYTQMVDMLRGEAGTAVNVKFYRQSTDSHIEIEIIRGVIDLPTVNHEMLDGQIGYIKIISFDAVTVKQFETAYEELTNDNMKALILDVRDNPGGILQAACTIADILVDAEFIVYVEDKNGKRDYKNADPDKIDIPLVVLINKNSASASEILAGAVKDTGTGILIGETTYGKGVVQSLYTLPDGSGIKVTTAKYYTPSGICIDGVGVSPDITVETGKDEDKQFEKAYEIALTP